MNTTKTSIGTSISGKSIMLERRNGNPFLSLQEKWPTVKYDFSRYEEKRKILAEIDFIMSDVLRVSNESKRLSELKLQLTVINEAEKQVA